MGTRAQFFIGNPQDVAGREWIGCVAWDGYPEGDIGRALKDVTSEREFREAVAKIKAKRDDFCDPATMSFPFPWRGDLFLTDLTYAWFGDKVQMTYFHHGWIPLADYLKHSDGYHDQQDNLPSNVPAPSSDKPRGPDSIMIITA